MKNGGFFKKKAILALMLVFCASLFVSANSHAFTPSDVTKKAYMYGLRQCYEKGAIRDEYVNIKEYSGGASLYKKNAVKDIPLPNGSSFNSTSKTAVDCKTLIKGGSGLQSAYAFMGHPAPASGAQDVGDFLKTYAGYTETSNSSESKGTCVFFTFRHTVTKASKTTTKEVNTDKICVEKLEDGIIRSIPTIYAENNNGWRRVPTGNATMNSASTTPVISIAEEGAISIRGGKKPLLIPTAGRKFDDVIKEIGGKWENTSLNWNGTTDAQGNACTPSPLGNSCQDNTTEYLGHKKESATIFTGYSKPDGNKAIQHLMGCEKGKENTCLSITREERVRVYMNYLTSVLGAKVMCNLSQEQISGNSYDGPIKWFESGKTNLTQNCYVQPSNTTTQLNGIDSGHFQYQSINYSGLIEFFKEPDITELSEPSDGGETQPDEAVNNLDGADASGKEPSCYDKTGALGWVLCPVTIAAGEFVEAFYGSMIQPFLQIDVGLFTEGNQTLFGVWQIFQGFANIAFVALFLFVIFSQITGYGIDNYGIKKTLPRLILGAIMINASFLICQLAVEVSNILGIGIRSLFEGIQVGISDIAVRGTSGSASTVGTIASVSLGAGGLAIVVAIIAVLIKNAVLALDRIVISVLLTIIVVIVALIFLFVVLSLRYALAILLVLVSPLAFVCYMLPNTKKVFDRWLSMFKGLLLAYPIVSALVFGGEFIGKLLLASQPAGAGHPVVLLLAVAIMAIAPVFMIPTVLMKSLGALSGVVERMRGSTQRAVHKMRPGMDRAFSNTSLGHRMKMQQEGMAHDKMIGRVTKRQQELEAKKNAGTLRGRERAEYMQNARIIDKDKRENREAYRTAEYGNMDEGTFAIRDANGNITTAGTGILAQFDDPSSFVIKTSKGDTKLDIDKAVAALTSIHKGDNKMAALARLSRTSEYQEAMKSVETRNLLADAVASGGGAANMALATAMRKPTIITQDTDGNRRGMSFDEMLQSGSNGEPSVFQKEVNDMGLNLANVMTKYDAKNIDVGGDTGTFSLANYTSAEQNGAILSSGATGDVEEEIASGMMNVMGAAGVSAAIATIGADRASGITDKIYDKASELNGGATVKSMLNNQARTVIENDTDGRFRGSLKPKLGQDFMDASQSRSGQDNTFLDVRGASQAATNPAPTSQPQNQPPQPPRNPDDAAPTS